MKKQITALIFTAAMIVSLTACSESASPSESTDATTSISANESTLSESTTDIGDKKQGDRLFPDIVYDEYSMLERETDKVYLAPASEDYILVIQQWNDDNQLIHLVAFDKKGTVIQYEIRETRCWENCVNLDEVIANHNGTLIEDSLYYHNGSYDDGTALWSQKLDVLMSLKGNGIGGLAIDNSDCCYIYRSSPITSEQTYGSYKNVLTENDFAILSCHTPSTDDYMLSKSEDIFVKAVDTDTLAGSVLHKNDAFTYHTETLLSYDNDGNCVQYEAVNVFDSPNDAEQYMFATNGYVQYEPTLKMTYDKPGNMELCGNIWTFTSYADEVGTIDACANQDNKAQWSKDTETEYWSKPYLTEAQLQSFLNNQENTNSEKTPNSAEELTETTGSSNANSEVTATLGNYDEPSETAAQESTEPSIGVYIYDKTTADINIYSVDGNRTAQGREWSVSFGEYKVSLQDFGQNELQCSVWMINGDNADFVAMAQGTFEGNMLRFNVSMSEVPDFSFGDITAYTLYVNEDGRGGPKTEFAAADVVQQNSIDGG